MTRQISTLSDLTPDPANRRKHTPRNIGMIVNALHEVGAARSIVVDEDGTILAGNGVVDAAAEAGIERVQVVDADVETIIAVRRTGLTDEQKRRLALFDNRAAELAEWDTAQIAADLEAGLSFDGLFSMDEIDGVLGEHSRADRTLEEIDSADLPANPVWCLCTIAIEKLPEVLSILEKLRAAGVTVEMSYEA